MKVLCIGDSLTFGYGIRKAHSWVGLLNNYSFDNFINKGVNGDTTTGMLSRFYQIIKSNDFEQTLIMGGSNDFLQNRPVNFVKDNLMLLIKDALLENLKTYILIPPLALKDLALKNWSSSIDYNKFNENILMLKDLLEKEIQDNSLPVKILDLSSVIPLEEKFYTDGLHLTEDGHKIIFNELKNYYKLK